MPRVRSRALSRRNVRGRGWHKKGYPENGDLYFQLKRAYAGFSRECWVNENESVEKLIQSMIWSLDGEGGIPEGLQYMFFYRRRALEPSEALVREIMDGGETVHVKAFDEEGDERIYSYPNWEVKAARGQVAEQNRRLGVRGLMVGREG